MFTQISWSDYITTVVVLLAGYYFLIAIRYYRSDIFKLLSGKTESAERANFSGAKNDLPEQKSNEAYMQRPAEEQHLFNSLQTVTDEVNAFLDEAANGQFDKNEITIPLKQILKKYALLKDSPLQEAVNKFIQSTCEVDCSVRLSEEELSDLWN